MLAKSIGLRPIHALRWQAIRGGLLRQGKLIWELPPQKTLVCSHAGQLYLRNRELSGLANAPTLRRSKGAGMSRWEWLEIVLKSIAISAAIACCFGAAAYVLLR